MVCSMLSADSAINANTHCINPLIISLWKYLLLFLATGIMVNIRNHLQLDVCVIQRLLKVPMFLCVHIANLH
jgi:hypothetical protein